MVLAENPLMGTRLFCAGLLCLSLLCWNLPSAQAAKRPVAIQTDTFQAPVQLPDGKFRQAEVTVYAVIPNVKFIEAACAYRSTVSDAAHHYMKANPMSLEAWGKLELGSQDAILSQVIKQSVRQPWIYRIHAVAGNRARPKYTVWYESVRVLRCSDWERWKNRKPPPPPPIFSEPIFQQFRKKKP